MATAVRDATARIAAHVARRPPAWRTVEAGEPGVLVEALRSAAPDGPVLLVDDLATWLTGVLDDAGAWEADPAALAQAEKVEAEQRAQLEAVAKARKAQVIVEAEAAAERRRIEAEGDVLEHG